MKKFILILSVLFAIVACSSDDTTVKEGNNQNGGDPDPSFAGTVVDTELFFQFTNSEGENILDPTSPAYIGDNAVHCKIYREDDYVTNHKAFKIEEERYTFDDELLHYSASYGLSQHFAEAVNGDYEQAKVFQKLTMDRMWLKGQIYFNDGTTYDVYAKLEKYNDGTYAVGANEIYINDELIYQGSPQGSLQLVIPIVKDE